VREGGLNVIQIVYQPDAHTVTMRGHAGGGEAGHDLVCASASILAYTLASFVLNLEETGAVESTEVDLLSGKATVGCKPTARSEADVRRIFGSICEGFSLLARNYPENVSFRTE
jgi:uncharacterized protein YsxB (DUF464 family)